MPPTRPTRSRISFAIGAVYMSVLLVWMVACVDYIADRFRHNELLVSGSGRIHIVDFVHFYEAGCLTRDPNTWLKVYDPYVQYNWQKEFIKPRQSSEVFYLQYVPFLFPLTLPLSFLTAPQGFIVWECLSLAAGAAALLCLNKLCRPLSPKVKFVVFAVAALSSLPGWILITIGQTGLFSLFFLSAFYLFLQKRQDVRAGLALAFASFKPHYALFLALAALADRRWKLLIVATAAEVALLTLAGTTIGWPNVVGYIPILLRAETSADPFIAGVSADRECCMRAVFSVFMPQRQALPMSFLLMVAALIVALVIWIRAFRTRERFIIQDWALSLTVILSLVFSPHTNSYDWIALVCVAWLTLPADHFGTDSALASSWAYRIWSCLLVLYPVLSWLTFLCLPFGGPQAQAFAFVTIGVALLISGSVVFVSLLRQNQEQQSLRIGPN